MVLSLKAVHIYTKVLLFSSTFYLSLNIKPVKSVVKIHFKAAGVPFVYLQNQTTSRFFFIFLLVFVSFLNFILFFRLTKEEASRMLPK